MTLMNPTARHTTKRPSYFFAFLAQFFALANFYYVTLVTVLVTFRFSYYLNDQYIADN